MLTHEEAMIKIIEILHSNQIAGIIVLQDDNTAYRHICKDIKPKAIVSCCLLCYNQLEEIQKKL